MKHILLASLLFFSLFACKPYKEKVCGKIDDSIRHYMERKADKEHKDLTIDELKTTDFDMIGAGRIDSMSKEYYTKKIASFLHLQQTAGANAKAYIDSVDYYMKLDSLTTLQITNRWQDRQDYYYSKTYVKATNGNVKTDDTVRYALDKTYKLISLF
jgi:hypothetical protein